jgi:hypothetical protein
MFGGTKQYDLCSQQLESKKDKDMSKIYGHVSPQTSSLFLSGLRRSGADSGRLPICCGESLIYFSIVYSGGSLVRGVIPFCIIDNEGFGWTRLFSTLWSKKLKAIMFPQ